MADSKYLAGLIGPSLVAITITETINVHIWADNTAAGVFLNGGLLFVAGLAIVRAHNLWVRNWPVVITVVGWAVMALGLFRMSAPELQLKGARNTDVVIAETLAVLAIGIFLTFKAYWPRR